MLLCIAPPLPLTTILVLLTHTWDVVVEENDCRSSSSCKTMYKGGTIALACS